MPNLYSVANVAKALAGRHPRLHLRKLKEGANVVHEERNGTKLVAFVVQGRVVDWIGYDPKGNEVPTVVTRKPAKKKLMARAAAVGTRYLVCVCLKGCTPCCWWVWCICGRCT